MVLIDNLAEWEETGQTTAKEATESDTKAEEEVVPAVVDLSALADQPILCAGARGNLDDAAAAMLAELLEAGSAKVRLLPHESLQTAQLRETDLGEPAIVVLCT